MATVFTNLSAVSDTVIDMVTDVVTLITANPLLLVGLGIGLFYGAVRIVKSFL